MKIEAALPYSLYSKVTTMLLKCATTKDGLVGNCFYRGTTNVGSNSPPIAFLTFSDFVHVYRALCIYCRSGNFCEFQFSQINNKNTPHPSNQSK